ncbi:hypothetical protein BLNAU_21953 [Blattamonas nauphoetae]|uniref:Protein kinase domain-containing protein n=1 Tax=Blattamonas nauphoetae TaxID=2049346 RepID=A0ABQ9WUG6_9EUKA|nr:hypothetical protein BLNAU_21953 [Blattamonas nauphoetae]
MIEFDARKRLSAQECLNHPWFRTVAPEVELPKQEQGGLNLLELLLLLALQPGGGGGGGSERDSDDGTTRKSTAPSVHPKPVPKQAPAPQPVPQPVHQSVSQYVSQSYVADSSQSVLVTGVLPRLVASTPLNSTPPASSQVRAVIQEMKSIRATPSPPFADAVQPSLEYFIQSLSKEGQVGAEQTCRVLAFLTQNCLDEWAKQDAKYIQLTQQPDANGNVIVGSTRMKVTELTKIRRELADQLSDMTDMVQENVSNIFGGARSAATLLNGLPANQRNEAGLTQYLALSLSQNIKIGTDGLLVLFAEALRYCPFHLPQHEAMRRIESIISQDKHEKAQKTLESFLKWMEIRQLRKDEAILCKDIPKLFPVPNAPPLSNHEQAALELKRNRAACALYGYLLICALAQSQFPLRKTSFAENGQSQSRVAVVTLSPDVLKEYTNQAFAFLMQVVNGSL